MANTVLAVTPLAEIDHVVVITITDLSVDGDRPVTVQFGAQGPIGSRKGQEKVTGTMKLSIPITGLEIDIRALMARAEGFTLSFGIGAERHQLYGVQLSKRSFATNHEASTFDFNSSFVATEWIRVA